MANKVFTFKICGAAGQGIKSAGSVFAKLAARSGYEVYNNIEYPSLIRGGHNVFEVSFSTEPVLSPRRQTDLLIALNRETIDKHKNELIPDSIIIFDGETDDNHVLSVPLSKIGRHPNVVALGAAAALLGGSLEILKTLLFEEFGGEEAEAEAGYNYIREHFSDKIKNVLAPKEGVIPKMVISGNDAVALGAIAAGLQFAAIYPMSPTNQILAVLAANQEKYGYVYKQPEDEIAAINMAIGASFAGARSMTVTSGGGFCLMTEGYGLAGMTETPVVIVDGMRGGPATGLPTWSEQGDLDFVLCAHQSDFPRLVLAAGDALEAFDLTRVAFNLADKYQTPVVLLLDKNLCENDQSFSPFETSGYQIDRGRIVWEKVADYKRYELLGDGISMRSVPGSGNHFLANSDEHDDRGFSTEEIFDRNQQMDKRMKKLATCAACDLPAPALYGPKEADVTIVSWGSNKGAILDAIQNFPNVNFLHLTWINPFPAVAVGEILGKAKHVINIEANYTAQMGGLIRKKTGIEITDNFLKYDGRPFFPEEIVDKINLSLRGA